MSIDGRSFVASGGPFKTKGDQWDFVLELAVELNVNLVELGAVSGPHKEFAEALAKFVQGEPL